MSKQEKGYNGNPNLPQNNRKRPFTQWELEEFIKCKNDPVYFAKNYIKIVTLDRGLETINLYDYQEEILGAYPDNLKLCLNQSRQSGKCVSHLSEITIRNKRTGEVTVTTIGDFHSLISKDNAPKDTL
jgi:hypothetical protein